MAVLSIQSHVAFGPVGNGAACFALRLLGHEAWPLNTVDYATHTGYGPPVGTVTPPETLRAMADQLDRLGMLARCVAVLSGYAGTADTASAIAGIADLVRARNPAALWCCDPVMGDEGRGLFVTEDVAVTVAECARHADMVLPNVFELGRLTGRDLSAHGTPDEVAAACRDLLDGGPRLVVATGVSAEPGCIATVVAEAGAGRLISVPAVAFDGRPNGAGDLFAAIFLGRYLTEPDAARASGHAAASLAGIIAETAATGGTELALVAARGCIAAPPTIPMSMARLW